MIRIPNRGLHDLISAPQALPIATVKRTYSKNVVPDVLSGKKGSLARLRKLDGRSSTRLGLSNKSFAAQTRHSVIHSEYWQPKVF